MKDIIRLEKEDVTVQRLLFRQCDDCDSEATHFIEIDFRIAGMAQSFGGRYCRPCAESIAARVRDGLPAAEPTR